MKRFKETKHLCIQCSPCAEFQFANGTLGFRTPSAGTTRGLVGPNLRSIGPGRGLSICRSTFQVKPVSLVPGPQFENHGPGLMLSESHPSSEMQAGRGGSRCPRCGWAQEPWERLGQFRARTAAPSRRTHLQLPALSVEMHAWELLCKL